MRPAVIDDLEQILAIEKLCYPEPWTIALFTAEMEKPFARFLVLTDDESDTQVFGYIIYWVQAEGVSLMNVCIDPNWQGLGLAKKLMHAMINETVRDEIPRIILEVRESNQNARKLYEAIGFKKSGERKKFYQNGETAIVMELKTSELSGMIQ
jgi:ribosomal-protein-alanine N-acetyltransferase